MGIIQNKARDLRENIRLRHAESDSFEFSGWWRSSWAKWLLRLLRGPSSLAPHPVHRPLYFSDPPPEGQGADPDGYWTDVDGGHILQTPVQRPRGTLKVTGIRPRPEASRMPQFSRKQSEAITAPLILSKGSKCKAGPRGRDEPPLFSPNPNNKRVLPDPGDQRQHTSPAKATPPQPRRRTCQPATPRPGDLSEPSSI